MLNPRRRRVQRWAALTLLALAPIGCSDRFGVTAGAAQADFDPRVLAYLECIECIDGERATVVGMGSVAVPGLRRAVLQGPAPARMALLDSTLRTLRKRIGRSRLLEPAITQQKVSFRTLYFRRGSDALGAIGSDSAIAALCLARQVDDVPARQRRFADSTLARMGASCP
ncbi:MAG: hypothetical protein IT355_05700 [Gemmatimonadaceae bacterium]|nr:hypothetical protein [Gemmatimonadaceae bacterium]